MILALYYKFPFILDRNLAKANCTENQVCTSCDIDDSGPCIVYIMIWVCIHDTSNASHKETFKKT